MTTPLIIGEGNYRYEVTDLWGDPAAYPRLGTTHGVIEDAAGRIFIHHTGAGESVSIFTPEGAYLGGWGAQYSAGAHGMLYNREAGGEFLYLAATGLGIVVKTTLEGEEVLRLGLPPREDLYGGEGKAYTPTEAAVASTGDIYIADGYGRQFIHRYTAAGDYVASFSGPGKDPGRSDNVHGIHIDTRSGRELLVATDRKQGRLNYFSLEGEFVRHSDPGLRMPCTAIPWRDELYVPDLFSRLTILDREDKVIAHLGDRPACWEKEGWPNIPNTDWLPGAFSSPHDLHVDPSGNIYVAEWIEDGRGKLTKLHRL